MHGAAPDNLKHNKGGQAYGKDDPPMIPFKRKDGQSKGWNAKDLSYKQQCVLIGHTFPSSDTWNTHLGRKVVLKKNSECSDRHDNFTDADPTFLNPTVEKSS